MKNSSFILFDECTLSNDLWPNFINQIGISKARIAVRQSLDLQNMQGNSFTLPVLIIETCGSALVSSEVVKSYTGIECQMQGMLLIYSKKLSSIQLLIDN
tara:strand:+ start:386 stop:685 length:300 start_codon:yes stop_codon:yes gene_type:complete